MTVRIKLEHVLRTVFGLNRELQDHTAVNASCYQHLLTFIKFALIHEGGLAGDAFLDPNQVFVEHMEFEIRCQHHIDLVLYGIGHRRNVMTFRFLLEVNFE